MNATGGGVSMFDDPAAHDEIRRVRADHRLVVTARGQRNHDVPCGERPQVGEQRGQFIAGFDQYQTALGAQFGGDGGDFLGELAVGQRLVVGEHREVLAVCREVLDEPFEHQRCERSSATTTAAPLTCIRTLASTAGGATLCWRTVIGATSSPRSTVNSTSWPRNSDANTVATPLPSSSSATVVASSCSGRSISVEEPRTSVSCTGSRPSAHSAVPAVTVQGSSTQSPRNSAVNRS